MTREEYNVSQESLLSYWESKGMIDTARDEGRLEGRAEGESKKAWMLQRKPLELV
jgi:hypothetical protein